MSELKRYPLSVPQETWDEIQELADKEHKPVLQVIREFIRLGIKIKRSGGVCYIKDGDEETKIMML